MPTKKADLKKSIYAGILLLVLQFTFISCSQKKEPAAVSSDNTVKEYVFNQLLNNKVPESFRNVVFRSVIERPVKDRIVFLYLFEKIYPDCSGIYDSKNIYSDACDSGEWVDDVIFSFQESLNGDELLSLLEDEDSILPPIDSTISDSEDSENSEAVEESVEKLLIDSYGKLKIMEFSTERFLPQKSNDSTVFVHYSNNNAVRVFYDELFRLVKKEYWKMTSVTDSKILVSEQYEYQGESKHPVNKIIKNETSKIVSNLDENGLVIKAQKYKTDSEEEQLSTVTEWKYDSKQRITLQTETEFTYNDTGKVTKRFTTKKVFIYDKVDLDEKKKGEKSDIPPDYEYYENNVLRRKTEYTNKSTYTNLIVFDTFDL